MKSLEQLAKNAKEMAEQGTQEVQLGDLMNQDFMEAHTKYPTLQDFFDASGFKIDSLQDFEAIPDEDWEEHVRSSSSFESWEEMQRTAALEYQRARLYKGV